jgi:hypothetical protein
MGRKDEEHLMKRNTFILGPWSSDATAHAGDPLKGGKSPRFPCLGTCMSSQGCGDLPKQRKSNYTKGSHEFHERLIAKAGTFQ